MVLRALAVRSALESSGPGPRPHLGARQDALDGAGGPLARVLGADPCAARGAGPQRAPQAPPLGLAPVRPARPPNACWQLDATEYVVAGGRKAVIFQLQDDHCRLAVAWLVAPGETSDAAIAVFDKGVAAHGVPQRLLTDNGAAHGPQPTGTRRTPGGARAGPRGRAPRRQGQIGRAHV